MTIDASLENISSELGRRCLAVIKRNELISEAILILLKNTAYKSVLCVNIIKSISGSRVSMTKLSIKQVSKFASKGDVNDLIEINRSMTSQINCFYFISDKMKISGKITKMINEYIVESENDLQKMYILEKRSRLTSR